MKAYTDFDSVALAPIRELVADIPRRLNGVLSFKDDISPWHGTTIAAFLVDNGKTIVAVSDGKVSEGQMLYAASLDFPKVVEIDRSTIMLFAGAAGFAALYSRILKNWVETMERVREVRLSARAKVNMLARMLRESLPFAASGFPVMAILATFDERKSARIFLFSPDGSNIQRESYAILGSGKVGEGVLVERWHPDMNRNEGIILAKRLVKVNATNLDSATGGQIFIKVLDENGVESVDGGRANE